MSTAHRPLHTAHRAANPSANDKSHSQRLTAVFWATSFQKVLQRLSAKVCGL